MIDFAKALRRAAVPGLAVLLLITAACSAATPVPATSAPATTVPPTATPAPAAAGAMTLTDALGRPVSLPAPAERIVTLAPSNTEILFALGAGNRIVGRDDFSDYPPEALNIQGLGTGYPTLNTEAIVALAPDLVLAGGITDPAEVERMEELGLTVYATHNAQSLDDIYADIRAVGQLVGQAEAAETLVADMQARIDQVTQLTGTAAEQPVVFYEVDATDPGKPWTAGPKTFISQLISLAGGKNAGDMASVDYAQLSLEQLVAQDPAVIVLGSATYGGQTPEMVAQRPGWGVLEAVQTGAVHSFDDNLVSRPGPRVVEGLETLARLIHPDLFD